MYRRRASLGRGWKGRVAALAVSAVALLGTSSLLAAPASAERVWGCTYSTGSPCYAPWAGAVNFLITMDPDHAIGFLGGGTENGYPAPKYDGVERHVCAAVYWDGGLTAPWSCTWGENVYTFALSWGQAMISSQVNYSKIALYQDINYTEEGP
jgi:hypothetical protein